jgi:hypothetical protein
MTGFDTTCVRRILARSLNSFLRPSQNCLKSPQIGQHVTGTIQKRYREYIIIGQYPALPE